jgi:hypothetical protein
MIVFHFNAFHEEKNSKKLLSNEDFLKANRVLIVTGDSWTNRMRGTFTNNDNDSWVPEYVRLRGYDFIIVAAAQGGSATQSFCNLVGLLSGVRFLDDTFGISGDHVSDSWLNHYQLKEKNVDVIIQWTSIIRDFSEFSAWYKPYTFASLPELSDDVFKKEMYDEYITHIVSEKYYSYKMQVYSWQLQKYFERWNIPYYFWMGFCDLVPESVEGSDMDIRKFLNKDRWFNLYEKPHNMADYLYSLEKKTLPKRLQGIMTEGGPSGFKTTLSKHLSNLFKQNNKDTSLDDTLFLNDLHANHNGNKIIAQTLNEKIPK